MKLPTLVVVEFSARGNATRKTRWPMESRSQTWPNVTKPGRGHGNIIVPLHVTRYCNAAALPGDVIANSARLREADAAASTYVPEFAIGSEGICFYSGEEEGRVGEGVLRRCVSFGYDPPPLSLQPPMHGIIASPFDKG